MNRKWIPLVLAFALSIAMYAQKKSEKPAAQHKHAEAERIVKGPVVEGVGDTTAVIAWTTNTGGSSVVHYGTDKSSLNQTAESPYADNDKTSAQNHRVHIKNLKPGTTYYFRVSSGQGEGTGTEAGSGEGTFTTKGKASSAGSRGSGEAGEKREGPVRITNGPKVEGTGGTWAVIAWTTNAASGSVIHFGTDRNNLSQTAQSPYADKEGASAQNHRVRVTNLKPNTTYYFVADSAHGEGTGTEAKSPVAEFKTKAR